MEKLNFVKNGELRLPPGFRFQPTDEEIVFQYLKHKVFSVPFPASNIIPETNVYRYDPWDLMPPGASTGELEQEMYFFCNKAETNKHRCTSNSGYWKATGLDDEQIASPSCRNGMIGIKKTLIFYRVKKRSLVEHRTNWVMHEYSLVYAEGTARGIISNVSSQGYPIEMENWVVCCIFHRKRSATNDHTSLNNFYSGQSSCNSSSSGSSEITEASSTAPNNDDDQESCFYSTMR